MEAAAAAASLNLRGGEGKKVVVAVDESEESMYALSWCVNNLLSDHNNHNSNNSTLVLLYVKPPPHLYLPLDASGFLFSNDAIGAIKKYGSDLVSSVMERADAVYRNLNANIQVEKKVGTGDAKEVICGMVDKIGADVLVLGSHRYGFFQRALLGSVSDHCAKTAKCPVVVVKKP